MVYRQFLFLSEQYLQDGWMNILWSPLYSALPGDLSVPQDFINPGIKRSNRVEDISVWIIDGSLLVMCLHLDSLWDISITEGWAEGHNDGSTTGPPYHCWENKEELMCDGWRDAELGVDRLSAPILSILPIIDIGHFQNRFADNFFFFFFIIMQTNILFTGDIIYWWINNTREIIYFLNALFGSMQPVWAQHSVRVRRSLNLWEQSPPTAHLICRESRVRPINAENWRQSHTESTC